MIHASGQDVINLDDVPDRRYGRTRATAPGPNGLSMLVHLPGILDDPLAFLLQVRRRFGPVAQFPAPRPPTFLIDDPGLVRSVLIVNSELFDKDTVQYRGLSRVTGDGLLTAPARAWRHQRPVVQPAFHRNSLDRLVADSARAAQRLAVRWEHAPSGSLVDVEQAMLEIGLQVVGEHLFGADLRANSSELSRATIQALDAVVASIRLPGGLVKGFPGRARRAVDRLDDAVASLVASRLASNRTTDDLLGLLLAAYPDDPGLVRDQVVTFLVAGHETVASALTWTLGLLAAHPAEQSRLGSQSRAVLGDDFRSSEHLPRLTEARKCLDEALRLYPPAWLITRRSSRDTVLGGRAIPSGSLLIMSPWLLHRDPRRWSNPEMFRPVRFEGEPGVAALAATRQGEYLPFGAGQRLCIGRDMALVEATIVLAELGRNFTFGLADTQLPPADALVTLRPSGGLRLRIYPSKP